MDVSMLSGVEQQQKTILSPQVLQSLKTLQMSAEELNSSIEKELEENPFLEVQPEEQYHSNSQADLKNNDNKLAVNEAEGYKYDSYIEIEGRHDSKNNPLDMLASGQTLKEYLLEQAGTLKARSLTISICNYIIENIDERGYLGCEEREIAEELKVSEKIVSDALKLVQSFNPSGVAARNLGECLKIQLRQKNIRDENVYKIVDSYLELAAENKLREIAKHLNVGIHKVQEYLEIIRALNPKPSRGFYTGKPEKYIIPEAYIKKVDKDIFILANHHSLPQLSLNNEYVWLIRQHKDDETTEFLKEKYERAVNLLRGIEERNKTIYSIIEKIVELQKDYFLNGVKYLKPMTIKDIAKSIKVHESTVSRAVKDKYVSTPFNTIRLKDLFSTGIKVKHTNEAISATVIKNEIRNLINSENKLCPLSDQDICDFLKRGNSEISRRTVAKYREELRIPSSSKRKKLL